MSKIEISRRNIFEDKAKAFSQSSLAQRLQDKYTPKPYEEKRKPLYYLSLVGSFFCNGLAVIASMSFVFAFSYALTIKALPYPAEISAIISVAALVFIEVAKRATVPDFFQDVYQYGFKTSYIIRMVAILGLVSASTFFSYKGGHEFVELVMSNPQYVAPTEKSTKTTQEQYKRQIATAEDNAERYRVSKLWRGKLADEHAKAYQRLLSRVAALQDKMNGETEKIEAQNRTDKENARSDFLQETKDHQEKVKRRGSGFAKFSIIGEILFILFIWYMERYDYKTATQYAVLDNIEAIPTQIAPAGKQATQTAPPPAKAPNNNGSVLNAVSDVERNPIGFKHYGNQPPDNLLQQVTQDTQGNPQTAQKVVIGYEDKYTILHKGKKKTQRYTIGRVNNIIGTYEKRIQQAKKQGKQAIVESREDVLKYWETRKRELLEKINA